MPAVPPWMLGKHVTSVKVTAQNVATDGTLTDAAGTSNEAAIQVSTGALHSTLAFSLGLVDEIEFTATKTTENISAIHRNRAHNVPISIRYQVTLTEILRTGANTCLLANVWANGVSDVVKFEFARARQKWTVYGVMTDYSETMQRGKNVGRLTFTMVEANTAVTYSSTATDR